MIRLVVRTDDANQAAHVGGAVQVTYKTFDVELPEVEAFIDEVREKKWQFTSRQIVGFEMLEKE